MAQIGFGGGCHWCTEAVFLSLKGVDSVRQGWISGHGKARDFSEAVLVRFAGEYISLKTLIEVHLRTHSSTSSHSLRSKYRSAVYVFSEAQAVEVLRTLAELQPFFGSPVITEVIPFRALRENDEQYLDYYGRNPGAPFCRTWIDPKIQLLHERFPTAVSLKKTQN